MDWTLLFVVSIVGTNYFAHCHKESKLAENCDALNILHKRAADTTETQNVAFLPENTANICSLLMIPRRAYKLL